jgi:methyl-accepting chemotaxis protein
MHLTIKRKLIGSYLVVLLTTMVLAGFGYSVLNRQTDTLNQITRVDSRLFAAAKQIETIMLQHRRYEKDFFLNIGKPEKQNQYLEKYMTKSVILKGLIEQFGVLVEGNAAAYLTEEIRNKVQLLFENYSLYYRGFFKVADQVRSDTTITPQKAGTLMTPYESTIHELESDIADVVSTVSAGIDRTGAKAGEEGRASKLVLLLFSAVCILLITALSLVVSSRILRLLNTSNSNAHATGEKSPNMSPVVTAGDPTSTNRGIVASSTEEINATAK